jgi:hypothetical protein
VSDSVMEEPGTWPILQWPPTVPLTRFVVRAARRDELGRQGDRRPGASNQKLDGHTALPEQ